MGNDQVVPLCGSDFTNTRQNRRNEVTVELVNQYADGFGLLATQVTGKMIGPVAKVSSQIKNPLFGFVKSSIKFLVINLGLIKKDCLLLGSYG